MALTFASLKGIPPFKGGWIFGLVDITLDNAYTAGGWAITAANVGLPTGGTLYCLIPSPSKGGYVLEWDQVNGKLQAFQEADGAGAMAEIDAADLNGEVVRCLVIGYGG